MITAILILVAVLVAAGAVFLTYRAVTGESMARLWVLTGGFDAAWRVVVVLIDAAVRVNRE